MVPHTEEQKEPTPASQTEEAQQPTPLAPSLQVSASSPAAPPKDIQILPQKPSFIPYFGVPD
jgi:hypothetical protein